MELVGNLGTIKKKEVRQTLTKKIATCRKTGENYVKNTVRTYLDQAEYLNLQDKTSDAKSSLAMAKKAMEDSMFTSSICQEWYNETANVLGVIAVPIIKKMIYSSDFVFDGKIVTNSIDMDFVKIPAGSFLMGCSTGDTECLVDEKPQHEVKITKSFYMGKYEVTQGQWKKVMRNNPSYFQNCGENCPVEQVSWNDVQEFIKKLCGMEKMNPCKYRLPTEAEWEYSARAGSTTELYNGKLETNGYFKSKNLDRIGWFAGNAKANYKGGFSYRKFVFNDAPHLFLGNQIVGKKKPNAWGLYDMIGNVYEWNEDWFGDKYYDKSPLVDPKGPDVGEGRVLRGSSWFNLANKSSRLSTRGVSSPGYRDFFVGFRLALLP